MNTSGHKSLIEARQELSGNGYKEAFSSPGRPYHFVKKGDRLAIREQDGEWLIVAYPGQPVIMPSELVQEEGFSATKI